MIIVIDGPAGSGKSSSAKEIANRLNINYLDSGALYRAITHVWIEAGKPVNKSFFDNLPVQNMNVSFHQGTFSVSVDGEDITSDIRKQTVSDHVSHVASNPVVRKYVNHYMRTLVEKDTFIADGRDLATAVFPNADIKIYMDASVDERAKRRFKEVKETGDHTTFQQIRENLKQRDYMDSHRKADPLKKAPDAITYDTTGKNFEEQIEELIQIIKENSNN